MGRVGPASEPKDSGPKSKEIFEERWESEKGDSARSGFSSICEGVIDDVRREEPESLLDPGTVLRP